MPNGGRLPVDDVADDLVAALGRGSRLILTAPTGSGKTTHVPQLVHAASRAWIPDGETIILQPRRLATRLVAARVASLLNTPLGGLVGYQTRRESVVSSGTRLRFMTEGLLLRLMQERTSLPRVAAVILDEFHERSVAADLALGLLLRLQGTSRPDLRVLVMSATLDVESLQPSLACPVLRAGGRAYPVDITYLDRPVAKPAWEAAAEALDGLLARGVEGDGLIFMPGAAEIHRTIEAARRVVDSRMLVVPLHGSLSPREQDEAVAPAPAGRRKVIVATNVAETSITIEGVRFVIDSGTARIHRFDHRRGLNSLRIEPISQASADQRAGRAGRTGPGVCVRLWTAKEHAQRELQTEPEIARVDLAEGILTLLSMNVEPASFAWPTAPEPERLAAAIDLLQGLHALDDQARITPMGRSMAAFPAHPRLARLMLEAAEQGVATRAATWAALVSERDLVSDTSTLTRHIDPADPPSDLAPRERLLDEARRASFDPSRCDRLGVHAASARDVDHSAGQLRRLAREKNAAESSGEGIGRLHRCVLAAYPDHVAFKPDAQKPFCIVPGRRKATLHRDSLVKGAGFLVALDIQESERQKRAAADVETTLALAVRIDPQWIQEELPECCSRRTTTRWDESSKGVVDAEEVIYRPPLLPADADGPAELVLDAVSRPTRNLAQAAEILLEQIDSGALVLEHWNEAVESWIARVRCVASWVPERHLMAYDEEDLRVLRLEIVSGATRASQVRERPCLEIVRSALSWEDQQLVERMAPEKLPLPQSYKGRPLKLAYVAPTATSAGTVKGSAKIQDLYGLTQTPTVGGGRVKVTMEILGPNYRPIQVTQDLAGFWTTLYPELKRELSRRYPRHEWR